VPDIPVESPPRLDIAPRSLVLELGDALERRNVNYCCQWKGNWKKKRWMSGEGDIDLLVDRTTRSWAFAARHHPRKPALRAWRAVSGWTPLPGA